MPTPFDQITEGNRERELMLRVRNGLVPNEQFESLVLPLFLKVQIQTISTCNAACVMCPWPETKGTQPQGRMEEHTFRTIVDQLAGRGVERTSLFLMNEPTLDHRLEALVHYVTVHEPRTTSVIFTNGVRLDGARAERLAASGLGEIDISVIGFDHDTYRANMGGLDYDHLLKNVREIGVAHRQGRLGNMVVKIIALEMPDVRSGLERFEAETGLQVYFKPVTNRAGLVDPEGLGACNPRRVRPQACQRPFVKAYFLYNGDMVLCNCDWRRTTIIGNVHDQSLEALWKSARLNEIRKAHVQGDYPPESLCSKCDYPWLA